MNIEISVVREILIPLPEYPHISANEPVAGAIALLMAHHSDDGCHLHFEDILVTGADGALVGQLPVRSILEHFFQPALRPSASDLFFEGSEHFADMIVIIDDWFKAECRRQSSATVEQYMTKHPLSVGASAHVVQALGMMLKNEKKVLPVTEDNVLQGAVRMEDIFKLLGNCCFRPFGTTNRIFTEG